MPGIDQILAQLTPKGGNTSCSEINRLINFIQNKKEVPQQWKEYIIALIYKNDGKLTLVIIDQCTKCYPIPYF
jgi:hypothetical protein